MNLLGEDRDEDDLRYSRRNALPRHNDSFAGSFMTYVYRFGWLFLGLSIISSFGHPACASSEFVRQIQKQLLTGQIDKAAAIAKSRLTADPNDDNARFALGAVQFLRGIEHLGQMLHRYGLQSQYNDRYGLTGLPILRLPVPDNPNPDELTYENFRNILKTFVENLEIAEATLAQIKAARVDFSLNIGLIRLDLNGDGLGTEWESLWRIWAVVTTDRGRLSAGTAQKLLVDFDESDVPWLRAYCHVLMAIAEFPLAHDWHQGFQAAFPSIFHMPRSKTHQLRNRLREIGPLPEHPSVTVPPGMSFQEWIRTPEYRRREQEYMRKSKLRLHYQSKLETFSIVDLIAFLHLTHWPVVERDRMASVLSHLEAVVDLSRENWKRILSETDNRNEWIPNPSQSGVLPGMSVTQERVEGWQKFLDEFEAILAGHKLIPHWRFDEGINMRRMFLEPRPFDIVLLLHGSAAVPYLQKGPVTDNVTWNQIMRLFGGDFFRYLIWFNYCCSQGGKHR